MTCYKVHIIQGTCPLGCVGKRVRNDAVLFKLLAYSFELIYCLGNLNAKVLEYGLVVENVAACKSAERNCKHLAVICRLGNSCLNELGMIILCIHISDIAGMSGLVILSHGTAAPVNVDVRTLSRTHCYNKLLLVVVILLMYMVDCDIGIVSCKTCLSYALVGILC